MKPSAFAKTSLCCIGNEFMNSRRGPLCQKVLENLILKPLFCFQLCQSCMYNMINFANQPLSQKTALQLPN
jgi:hypothetical protein